MSSRSKAGKPTNSPPEGLAWVWLTEDMMSSATFKALGPSAVRVLFFLAVQHMQNGGNENGNLGASHRQLKAAGVTGDDIRPAIDELELTGFIRRVSIGPRQADGTQPSRFALTWLPTKVSSPDAQHATNDWQKVRASLVRAGTTNGVNNVPAVRKWIKSNVDRRGTTAGTKIQRNPSCEERPAPQMRAA